MGMYIDHRLRRSRGLWVVLGVPFLAALSCLAFAAAPASAKRTHLFIEAFGSSAQPTFASAGGLAVDPGTGDLFVIDAGAKTVSRFNSDGTPDNFSALGTNVIDANGGGQCSTVPADCDQTPQNGFIFNPGVGEQQVAVDNSGTSTDGNIYVTQGSKSGGNLVDIFAGDGEYLGQLTAAGATKFGTTGSFPFSPCGVAVDGAGNVYLGGGYDNAIYKFAPTANPPVNGDIAATFPTGERLCGLAAGAGASAGSLFATTFFTFLPDRVLKFDSTSETMQYVVEEGEDRSVSVDPVSGNLLALRESGEIVEYDASGPSPELLSTTAPVSGAAGLAINGPSLYVAVATTGSPQPVKVYGPIVPIPDVATGPAEITGDTSLTLRGTVDPDGVPLEECYFEYGPTDTYGTTVPCAESVGEIGTTEKEVHVDIGGLTPESSYHYRLVAKNANATVPGADKTFKTPTKPAIPSVGSVDVSRTGATLIAKINPENSPTTYHFEWGLDTSYGNNTQELSVGSDNTEHVASQVLGQLVPGAIYHYRVVAVNGIGLTESGDRSFTTYPEASSPRSGSCANDAFRIGLSAPLPNCRAYELVSPIDKNGGDIKALVNNRNFPTRLDQSSVDGNQVTYSAVPAFSDSESAPFVSQYMATRVPGQGWSTEAINAPRESVALTTGPYRFDTQYKLFSEDLRDGWLFQDANPPLSSCAPAGFLNLYRRDSVTGAYEALIPNAPTNVTPSSDYRLELQGVSEDGSRRVFRANAKLTDDAAGGNQYQLYEHIAGEGCGELRVVSMMTNGKASGENASAGTPSGPGEYHEGTVARAVSNDGSRVFFTLGSISNGPATLFLRVNSDREQSPVSAGSCTDSSKGCTLKVSSSIASFWTAASDGSVGLYSTGGDLFEYDVEKALAGEPPNTLIAGESKGVVAASEDLSVLYFVSTEEIDGEGVAGRTNLYLYRPDQVGSERYRLVATLGPEDLRSFQHLGFSLGHPEPIRNGVRVTADGSKLAFVSTTSLTGYDNTDAIDGRPALEVFLYDAGSGKLVCVSCNPSGAQPQGRAFGPENDLVRTVAAMMAPGETQSFAPRSLSADGSRLLFESFESLLPRDVNERSDVYQWEWAAGPGDCEASGAELYVAASGGCLSLISSGQDEVDSEFADASPDGSNIFIRTLSSLLPQDPGQVDVYDVREGGGFPIPPPPREGCAGEACPSSPPPPPAENGVATQGPSTGNIPPPKTPKPCPKGKVRKAGKCVPKKHKGKKAKKKAGNKKKGARR